MRLFVMVVGSWQENRLLSLIAGIGALQQNQGAGSIFRKIDLAHFLSTGLVGAPPQARSDSLFSGACGNRRRPIREVGFVGEAAGVFFELGVDGF